MFFNSLYELLYLIFLIQLVLSNLIIFILIVYYLIIIVYYLIFIFNFLFCKFYITNQQKCNLCIIDSQKQDLNKQFSVYYQYFYNNKDY